MGAVAKVDRTTCECDVRYYLQAATLTCVECPEGQLASQSCRPFTRAFRQPFRFVCLTATVSAGAESLGDASIERGVVCVQGLSAVTRASQSSSFRCPLATLSNISAATRLSLCCVVVVL